MKLMNRFNLIPQFQQSAFTFYHTVFISIAVLLTTDSIMQTAAAQSESAGQWSDPSPHEIRYVTVASGVQLEVLDWGGSGGLIPAIRHSPMHPQLQWN
jgi:hypothetical protein